MLARYSTKVLTESAATAAAAADDFDDLYHLCWTKKMWFIILLHKLIRKVSLIYILTSFIAL